MMNTSGFFMVLGLLANFALAMASGEVQDGVGYAAAFQGMAIANVANGYLNFSDTGISDLDKEVTICAWKKDLHNDERSRFGVNLVHPGDTNFFQPDYGVGGYVGGFTINYRDNAKLLQVPGEWNYHCTSFDGNNGNFKAYVNGNVALETTISTVTTFRQEKITLIIGGNLYSFIDKEVTANPSMNAHCLFDDIAVYTRVLTPQEVATQAVVNDASLMLYYNFDDFVGTGVSSNLTMVQNLGTAGSKYDLFLGGVTTEPGVDLVWHYPSVDLSQDCIIGNQFDPVLVVASDAPIPGKQDQTNAFVFYVDLGVTTSLKIQLDAVKTRIELLSAPATMSLNETTGKTWNGVDYFEFEVTTSPGDDANSFTFDVDGIVHAVHLWPSEKPRLEAKSASLLEDRDSFLRLNEFSIDPSGGILEISIVQLPQNGKLFQVTRANGTMAFSKGDPILTNQARVFDLQGGVIYQPLENYAGGDSFTFEARSDRSGLTSETQTASIVINSDNDLPLTFSEGVTVVDEDSNGTIITLNSSDVEGMAFSVFITELPTQGKLYTRNVDNGDGEWVQVQQPYKVFEVEPVQYQYVRDVVDVSSFWGNAPSLAYHAMGVIGQPSCSSYGECEGEKPKSWIVGDIVRVVPPFAPSEAPYDLAAQIIDIQPGDNHTVRILPMFKLTNQADPNSAYVECLLKGSNYPADCVTTFTESELIVSDLPYDKVTLPISLTWCPLNKDYKGDQDIIAGQSAAAYGMQYNYHHNQVGHYTQNDPPYTEYIEVKYAEALYPVDIEIGSPRGYGGVVNVKALDPEGKWKTLYTGSPTRETYLTRKLQGEYDRFSPSLCRASFKTDTLRIEVDTSSETGVGDWNYMDYIKFYGSKTKQHAVLPYPSKQVLYIPNKNAFGDDHFSFGASDCGGNRFRHGLQSKVDLFITSIDDLPTAFLVSENIPIALGNLGMSNFQVELIDVDQDVNLTAKISNFPEFGEIALMSNDWEALTQEHAVLFGPARLTEENKVLSFRFTAPEKCEEKRVLETLLTITVSDTFRTQSVNIPIQWDCSRLEWKFVDSLTITAIMMSLAVLIVFGVGRQVYKQNGIALHILDIVFSPLSIMICTLCFEIADVVTDIVACIGITQNATNEVLPYVPYYVSLVSVAFFVSVWGMVKRIVYARWAYRSMLGRTQLLHSQLSSVAPADVAVVEETTEDEQNQSHENTHMHNTASSLIDFELESVRRHLGAVKVTLVLLLSEDLPLLILTILIASADNTVLQRTTFIISFFLNFGLFVIKVTSISSMRKLRKDRVRLLELKDILNEEKDLKNVVTASTALLLKTKAHMTMSNDRQMQSFVKSRKFSGK